MPCYRPGPALSPNYDDDDDGKEQEKEEEEEEEERDACEPCTYVSVNDEDYRSFLAAGEKLKASSLWAPFSPFHVQWRRKTFVERTSEPTTLRGFIIPFRFSLLPTLRTKEEFETHVHANTVYTRAQVDFDTANWNEIA